jgi:hypothetical protein
MGKRAYVLFLLSLILILSSGAISWAASIASPAQLIVVRASDDSLWKATCSAYPQTCTGFTSFPGRFASTPTVVWDGELLRYMVWGRAADGSIWKATFSKYGDFYDDWEVVPGSTPSQIGAAGSNLSYPYNFWIDKFSIDVSTLSTDCANMTNLGYQYMTAPSDGYINLSASGIYAPALANKWIKICLSETSNGGSCDSYSPFIESSSVGPVYEGERRYALNHVIKNVDGNNTYYFYLKACRETGATGVLYWNDVIGIFTK